MKIGKRNIWTAVKISVFALLVTIFGLKDDVFGRGGRGGGRGGIGGGGGGRGGGGSRGGRGGRGGGNNRGTNSKEEQERERKELRMQRVEAARWEYARRERELLWGAESKTRLDHQVGVIIRTNTE